MSRLLSQSQKGLAAFSGHVYSSIVWELIKPSLWTVVPQDILQLHSVKREVSLRTVLHTILHTVPMNCCSSHYTIVPQCEYARCPANCCCSHHTFHCVKIDASLSTVLLHTILQFHCVQIDASLWIVSLHYTRPFTIWKQTFPYELLFFTLYHTFTVWMQTCPQDWKCWMCYFGNSEMQTAIPEGLGSVTFVHLQKTNGNLCVLLPLSSGSREQWVIS